MCCCICTIPAKNNAIKSSTGSCKEKYEKIKRDISTATEIGSRGGVIIIEKKGSWKIPHAITLVHFVYSNRYHYRRKITIAAIFLESNYDKLYS